MKQARQGRGRQGSPICGVVSLLAPNMGVLCAGKEGAAEPGTLSPDHPLKSLEQSLSQLDPFTHAAKPLTAAPVEPAVAAPQLKKGPSRLGMKLRGNSFEAFEDVAVPSDAGHLNAPDSATAASAAEQGGEGAAGKSKGKGPRHRRTTRQADPILWIYICG